MDGRGVKALRRCGERDPKEAKLKRGSSRRAI
jgi:hypothetical protein